MAERGCVASYIEAYLRSDGFGSGCRYTQSFRNWFVVTTVVTTVSITL